MPVAFHQSVEALGPGAAGRLLIRQSLPLSNPYWTTNPLFILFLREVRPLSGGGRIPLWVVGTIAGIGAIFIVSLFFYGAYAGLGSSL